MPSPSFTTRPSLAELSCIGEAFCEMVAWFWPFACSLVCFSCFVCSFVFVFLFFVSRWEASSWLMHHVYKGKHPYGCWGSLITTKYFYFMARERVMMRVHVPSLSPCVTCTFFLPVALRVSWQYKLGLAGGVSARLDHTRSRIPVPVISYTLPLPGRFFWNGLFTRWFACKTHTSKYSYSPRRRDV